MGNATVCKKFLSLSEGFSKEEARRRVLRWFVAGFDDAAWDPAAQQKHHVHVVGGRQLRDLADDAPGWRDISEEELEEMVAAHD